MLSGANKETKKQRNKQTNKQTNKQKPKTKKNKKKDLILTTLPYIFFLKKKSLI